MGWNIMKYKIITEKVCKMANFIVMGTWDTKREELEFICEKIKKRSHHPIKLDLSTKKIKGTRDTVVSHTVSQAKERLKKIMEGKPVSGALSIGGGTNLFMSTKLMEGLPLFIPKIIVSTMIVNSVHTKSSNSKNRSPNSPSSRTTSKSGSSSPATHTSTS